MKKLVLTLALLLALLPVGGASAADWPPGPAFLDMVCDDTPYTTYWPIGSGIFFFPDGSVGHLRATWDWNGSEWTLVYQHPGTGYDAAMRCVWTRPSTGTLRMAAVQVSPPH